MEMPKDYETAQVIGGAKKLPPNGYVCVVKKAEERNNKNGKPMLVVAFEIYDGEYKGFFSEKFEKKKDFAAPGEQVKWPNDGMLYLNVYDKEGNTAKGFKTFCEALKDSGANIVWGQGFCQSITGKLFGALFRRREEQFDGKVFWSCKAFNYISVERIQKGDFSIPEDEPLRSQDFDAPGFSALDESDVPF